MNVAALRYIDSKKGKWTVFENDSINPTKHILIRVGDDKYRSIFRIEFVTLSTYVLCYMRVGTI